MADWDEPELTSLYTEVLESLKDRDVDSATMFASAPTNPVESMIRYVRASNKFQEYLSAVWTDKILSVAGGGTGAATAAGARTNLGLGTISTQDSNNVTITGGAITAAALTSGTIPDARFPSTLPALNGSALTALNASNLASGTVALARISALTTSQFASANISQWTNNSAYIDGSALNASNLSSGTVPDARLSSAILKSDTASIRINTASRIFSDTTTSSPEGRITAEPGEIFLRYGSSSVIYKKSTGSGNTGWVLVS